MGYFVVISCIFVGIRVGMGSVLELAWVSSTLGALRIALFSLIK